MSEDKLNAAKIMKMLDALLKLKDVITNEIEKEADAKKRKKYYAAMDNVLADPSVNNIISFRDLLHKV